MKKKLFTFVPAFILLILIVTLISLPFILNKSKNNLIGGDKDSYDCLIGAGYSWSEEINACVRSWEVKNESIKEIAKKSASKLISEGYSQITIASIETLNCPGCYTVMASAGEKRLRLNIINSEVLEIVNLFDSGSEKIYCADENRGNIICTLDYTPVCGHKVTSCEEEFCYRTYGNACMACSDSSIDYYQTGECK